MNLNTIQGKGFSTGGITISPRNPATPVNRPKHTKEQHRRLEIAKSGRDELDESVKEVWDD